MPKMNLDQAVFEIKKGNVIAFPTETVYGLGALATDGHAVGKVFLVKNRPSDNPLICHFYSWEQILEYVQPVNEYTKTLLKELTPGPASFLLKLLPNSPLRAATGGLETVICRVPNHPLTLGLIKKLNTPIVGPSANISGRPSSTNPEMVLEQFGEKISGVLDGGNSEIGVESTILDCLNSNSINILRPGAVGKSELSDIFQKHNLKVEILESETFTQTIPGNKYPHYSPKTSLLQINSISEISESSNYIIIATGEYLKQNNLKENTNNNIQIINLGSIENLETIARNLYQNLQKVDSLNSPKAFLIKENWPENTLGIAIKNRLDKVGLN